MIFIGDIAIGDVDKYPTVVGFPDIFKQEMVIANLEGQIVPSEKDLCNSLSLYNRFNGIQKFITDINVCAFGLANNHIFDVSESMKYTVERLNELNIKSFGVESNEILIDKYYRLHDSQGEVIVLNFGSELVGCRDVENNFVNKLTKENVVAKISETKQKYPGSKLVLYLHWGIELEQTPTPTMRMMSKLFIESGADLIVGNHTHCIMGYETYLEKYIFYGLGNFLLQEHLFFNGKLSYPRISSLQIALQFDTTLSNFIVHTCVHNSESRVLKYICAHELSKHPVLKDLSIGFTLNYDQFYRCNKRKTRLLPTIYSNDSLFVVFLKERLINIRGSLIKILIKIKLISV